MNTSDKHVAENSTPAPVVPENKALNMVETNDAAPGTLDTVPDNDPLAVLSDDQKPGSKDEEPAISAGSKFQSEFLYTLTPDQRREAAKYCTGAAKAWGAEPSEKDGTLWIGKADLRTLARALLAVVDQLLTQPTSDRQAEIKIWALLNDGWLMRAYKVAHADHEFMYTPYRIYIRNGSFDKYSDVSRADESEQLNRASAWTLVKAFRAQFLAAVNVVMPRNTRDTPLTAYSAEKTPKDAKQATRHKATRDTMKRTSVKRTPEECIWHGRSDSHLMQILYDLMDSHNGALATKADLSEYYKYAGWLRRQERKGNCRDASGFQNVKSSGSRDSNSSRGSNRSRGNRCMGNSSDGQRKTLYTVKTKSGGKPGQIGTKSSGRVKLGNA